MLKKFVFVPLLALSLLMFITGVAMADGPDTELSPASFANPMTTLIRVQNFDTTQTASVGVTFYDTSGASTAGTSVSVPPYAGRDMSQSVLSTPFQGSAVVQSSANSGAVVIQQTQGGTSLGTSFANDAYSSYSNSRFIANDLFFPQLLKDVFDAGQGKN